MSEFKHIENTFNSRIQDIKGQVRQRGSQVFRLQQHPPGPDEVEDQHLAGTQDLLFLVRQDQETL